MRKSRTRKTPRIQEFCARWTRDTCVHVRMTQSCLEDDSRLIKTHDSILHDGLTAVSTVEYRFSAKKRMKIIFAESNQILEKNKHKRPFGLLILYIRSEVYLGGDTIVLSRTHPRHLLPSIFVLFCFSPIRCSHTKNVQRKQWSPFTGRRRKTFTAPTSHIGRSRTRTTSTTLFGTFHLLLCLHSRGRDRSLEVAHDPGP